MIVTKNVHLYLDICSFQNLVLTKTFVDVFPYFSSKTSFCEFIQQQIKLAIFFLIPYRNGMSYFLPSYFLRSRTIN